MRVAIIGAGAIGGVYGAGLIESGADVVFVTRTAGQAERLARDGLTIRHRGRARTHRVVATAEPSSAGPMDLLLVLVKCYSTEAAIRAAAPMIGARTLVASLQNGWGNADVLGRAVSPEQLVVGITYHSATVLEPGEVEHTDTGATRLGQLHDAATGAAER